jgi:hypothetical protein
MKSMDFFFCQCEGEQRSQAEKDAISCRVMGGDWYYLQNDNGD